MMCFRRSVSGSVPAVQWRRVQAFTSAQVRKTLAHVHSHSARIFAYTLALDGARWRVPWHASIMHDDILLGGDVRAKRVAPSQADWKAPGKRMYHAHRKGRSHDDSTTGTRTRENSDPVAR